MAHRQHEEIVAVTTPLEVHAEVIREPGAPWRRLLRLDGDDCSHVNVEDPTDIDFAYVRLLADIADVIAPGRRPLRTVHLGGGAFTLPRYIRATRPASKQVVAEYDPGIVDLARAELGLQTDARLKVRVKDALAVLEEQPTASADLVVLDCFVGIDVPAHLVTASACHGVRRVTGAAGYYAANIIDSDPARPVCGELLEHFRNVVAIGPRKVMRGRVGGNVILLASDRDLPLNQLRKRALHGPTPSFVLPGAEFCTS